MRDSFSRDQPFHDGFNLGADKVRDLVKTIQENWVKHGYNGEFVFTITHGKPDATEERHALQNVEEVLRTHNTSENPIVHLKVSAFTTKAIEEEDLLETVNCVIEYGSEKQNLPESNNKNQRVKLSVTGSDQRWTRELYLEVKEQVERTFINERLYKVAEFVSRYRRPLLFSIFIACLLAIWLFGINLTKTDTLLAVSEKQAALESLLEKSDNLSSIEEKVNFLYEERLLQLEIIRINSDENVEPILQRLHYKNLFRILVWVVLAACTIFTFVNHFPVENFIWGDFEDRHSNTVSRRNFWLFGIVIASIVNLVTGFYP